MLRRELHGLPPMFHEITLPITEPVLIVALVLLVVLLAPLLFARLRMPGIVGLILAGVIIGPHNLGLLERDLTMQVLGTIGLLYIMFLAGLDVNLYEFTKYRNRSIVFGVLTFALPQGLGTLMAAYLLGFEWIQAILLGSVFASHTLLAYPIVSKLGIAKTQAVTTAVGATIITDTAALLVLAVIARSTEGDVGPTFWLIFLGLLVLYTAGLFWGLPRLGRWFFRVRAGDTAEYVFVLASVFVCAFLAEFIGVEAIIGAFFAGFALNRLVPEQSALMTRIHFVGDALFIPFFLISVGMLVDLNVLMGGAAAWFVAGSMVVTVSVTKWLAAMLTGTLFRYSAAKAWMLFGLTIPQAAATLAAVLIGYDLELFGEDVLNGTILMILVTCMLGPWITDRYGRRVVLEEAQVPFQRSEAPQRVLVPLANPQTEPYLVDLAILIREQASLEPLFPLIVVRDGEDAQAQVAAGEKLLGHAVMHATAANVPVYPVTRVDYNVAKGILRAVKETLASIIVVGWSGRDMRHEFIFGSVLDQLVSGSREMVLVSRLEMPINTCRRIVVAVPPLAHREPGFEPALRTLSRLAAQLGASIAFVADEPTIEAQQQAMTPMKLGVSAGYERLSTWASSHVVQTLERIVAANDVLVLMNTRTGSLAWRPMLNQLPRILARRFEGTSFLVLYMPTHGHPTWSGHATARGRPDIPAIPGEENVVFELKGGSSEGLLHDLLDSSLSNRPGLKERALQALSSVDPAYVPELHPGVIFYHGHVDGIDSPLLLVGINREGVLLPGADHPVSVLITLLSPESDPPEWHLRRLAFVAHVVHAEHAVERLRKATSPSELQVIFHDAWYASAGSSRDEVSSLTEVPEGATSSK